MTARPGSDFNWLGGAGFECTLDREAEWRAGIRASAAHDQHQRMDANADADQRGERKFLVPTPEQPKHAQCQDDDRGGNEPVGAI